MRLHFPVRVGSHENSVRRKNRAEPLETFVGWSSFYVVGRWVHRQSSGKINSVVAAKVVLPAENDGTARRVSGN